MRTLHVIITNLEKKRDSLMVYKTTLDIPAVVVVLVAVLNNAFEVSMMLLDSSIIL